MSERPQRERASTGAGILPTSDDGNLTSLFQTKTKESMECIAVCICKPSWDAACRQGWWRHSTIGSSPSFSSIFLRAAFILKPTPSPRWPAAALGLCRTISEPPLPGGPATGVVGVGGATCPSFPGRVSRVGTPKRSGRPGTRRGPPTGPSLTVWRFPQGPPRPVSTAGTGG